MHFLLIIVYDMIVTAVMGAFVFALIAIVFIGKQARHIPDIYIIKTYKIKPFYTYSTCAPGSR